MFQAKAEWLFSRPEGDIPSGLGQEARDPCTGEGNQITATLTWPPPLHMGLPLEGAGGLRGRGMGAVTPKEEAGWRSS
jgi:hypothetical protein